MNMTDELDNIITKLNNTTVNFLLYTQITLH